MQEKRKRAGIIGCGVIAQVHAWVLRNMKEVDLVAFCDIDEARARALAGPEGLVLNDWRKFCELDLDVVHICTPHYLHVPMAVELLRSGKAVFVEKPCAVTMEQFKELEEADKKYHKRLGFCFQNRYNDTTLFTDKIVAEGKLGKIKGARAMVTWRRDEDYYASSPWKGRRDTEGGGALINQAIHTLDLVLKYMGDPVEVKGNTNNHHLNSNDIEIEDTVEAWMSFPEGGRACFYASNAYVTDAPVYLELQGESGRIYMNGPEVTVCINGEQPEHYVLETKEGIGKDYWGCGHRACIEDFYKCLDSGEPYINSLEGVKRSFMTLMKIYESAGVIHEL